MNEEMIKEAVAAGRSSARSVMQVRHSQLEKRRALFPVAEDSDAVLHAAAKGVPLGLVEGVGGRSREDVLIAEGDSWFDYPWHDVLSMLEDRHGYEVEEVAHRGDRIEDMAYSGGQLAKFARKIEKSIRRGEVPKAVLLSGGGNDIAGDDFHMLLNHRDSSTAGVNEFVAAGVIDERLMESYARILGRISEVSQSLIGRDLPVLVHGYGYTVPDGRGYGGGWGPLPGPWLEPGFERKGYARSAMDERREIVRSLIDRFNLRLAELATLDPFANFVHYIDLRLLLPDTEEWWANELHPTRVGFERVSDRFQEALSQLEI
ncbi:MAG: SGNH/GDSL hydrolase family protein [Myxococcota bacterium]